MKKYIVLFIFSFCLSSLSGMTILEIKGDTIDPPGKPLPQKPYTDDDINQLVDDLNTPLPPGDPTPPLPMATEADLRQLFADLGIQYDDHIDEVWKSNDGYSATFRQVIRENYVHKQPEISNWFAACATLAGTYDQVLISSKEVKERLGYWEQFSNCYNLSDPSIFDCFKFRVSKFLFQREGSGKELLLLLNRCGPIVLAAPGVDKAVVVTEVTCDANWNCYVHVMDYAPNTSKFANPSDVKKTNVLVQPGTPLRGMNRANYTQLNRVGSGVEVKLTISELFSKFNSRSNIPVELFVGIESKTESVAQMIKK